MLDLPVRIASLALLVLLTGCATQPSAPDSQQSRFGFELFESDRKVAGREAPAKVAVKPSAEVADEHDYRLPSLAESILQRGFELVGTPYRFGGSSTGTGFDCSGFVGFVFRNEAGIDLPRSTREMINLDAPPVKRHELEPGDLVFFNNRGRGRVSHAGIYIGDDQFIHSSSSRSGGVRVDSLDDKYWRASYMEAKRVLAMAPEAESATFSR